MLNIYPKEQHEVLNRARDVFATAKGEHAYARRSGIEGTLFQGIRLCGLRTTRYRGLAKTSLQHVATAVGINLARVFNWLEGKPRAHTRTSHFAALAVDSRFRQQDHVRLSIGLETASTKALVVDRTA